MDIPTHYYNLRSRVLVIGEGKGGDYAAEKRPHFPERVVRCIWHDRRLKKNRLKTVDGREVEVLSQGEWNRGAGPDFLDACVIVEGNEKRGDVEIHTCASGWKQHGHHKNKEYKNVVLHVFMWNDEKGPADIPQLELFPFLDDDLTVIALTLDLENYPFSSLSRVGECNQLIGEHSAALMHLVRCAGQERLFMKARRFERRLEKSTLDETIYRGLMEGMGYRPNKRAFARLAELAPHSAVRKVQRKAGAGRAEILQSLFFHASGLLRGVQFNLWDVESREYAIRLDKYWEEWKGSLPGGRMKPNEWKTGGVRPANFPLRRMAGMSLLLAALPADGLGSMILDFGNELKESKGQKQVRAAARGFEKSLVQPGIGYWSRHLLPGGGFKEKVPALIGASLAGTLTLNIVLPVILCEAERTGDDALSKAVLDAYETFPALDIHQITRLMAYRIWGAHDAGVPAKKEIYQQGLLQIFFDFCDGNIKDCSACAFPEMIRLHESV